MSSIKERLVDFLWDHFWTTFAVVAVVLIGSCVVGYNVTAHRALAARMSSTVTVGVEDCFVRYHYDATGTQASVEVVHPKELSFVQVVPEVEHYRSGKATRTRTTFGVEFRSANGPIIIVVNPERDEIVASIMAITVRPNV